MLIKAQTGYVVRIILITITGIASGWSLQTIQGPYLSGMLGILLIALIINTLYYNLRINRRTNYFFESVRNEDFSLVYPAKSGDKITQNLNANLNRINNQIRQIYLQARGEEQYFGALIEQVPTGILSFDNKGFIIHANTALKKMLGFTQFTHIRQLDKVDKSIANFIIKKNNNINNNLITITGRNGAMSILLKKSFLKKDDREVTLVTLQDINTELDEKELDSWSKLIRVLTHEIMNSITPLTSLSQNLCSYFIKDGEIIPIESINEKMIETTVRGLKIINEQGQGLTRFVETYRELTRLPKPVLSTIKVYDLTEKIIMFCHHDMLDKNIDISITGKDQYLTIQADEKQISRVLINLIKNSIESLEKTINPKINLKYSKNLKGKVEISVSDNGPGIPEEIIDEIFVPFFTTKEKGSGIGLSLSRQIMRMHDGGLRVYSNPGIETKFTLIFSKSNIS